MQEKNPLMTLAKGDNNVIFYCSKVMMEKINQQGLLIKQLATRGTQEVSGDLLKPEDGKCP